ncbi:hypothetical protein IEO21_05561 [Rhodonia placenta]|uniref:Uncharacterized protein n=1 Tax=Rhodonia placenta TaxID=104341 RepID=A0A8H7U274_9APHY|nr:hypothetical protein IEO21_05561 [Postia placenta]
MSIWEATQGDAAHAGGIRNGVPDRRVTVGESDEETCVSDGALRLSDDETCVSEDEIDEDEESEDEEEENNANDPLHRDEFDETGDRYTVSWLAGMVTAIRYPEVILEFGLGYVPHQAIAEAKEIHRRLLRGILLRETNIVAAPPKCNALLMHKHSSGEMIAIDLRPSVLYSISWGGPL